MKPSTIRFDYHNQAWIKDGCYVPCGHPAAMNCQCYGKLHAGELAPAAVASGADAPSRPTVR